MLTRTMSSDPPRQARHAGQPDSIVEGTLPRIAVKKPAYIRKARRSARKTARGKLVSRRLTWSDNCAKNSKPCKAINRIPVPRTKGTDRTAPPGGTPRGQSPEDKE